MENLSREQINNEDNIGPGSSIGDSAGGDVASVDDMHEIRSRIDPDKTAKIQESIQGKLPEGWNFRPMIFRAKGVDWDEQYQIAQIYDENYMDKPHLRDRLIDNLNKNFQRYKDGSSEFWYLDISGGIIAFCRIEDVSTENNKIYKFDTFNVKQTLASRGIGKIFFDSIVGELGKDATILAESDADMPSTKFYLENGFCIYDFYELDEIVVAKIFRSPGDVGMDLSKFVEIENLEELFSTHGAEDKVIEQDNLIFVRYDTSAVSGSVMASCLTNLKSSGKDILLVKKMVSKDYTYLVFEKKDRGFIENSVDITR